MHLAIAQGTLGQAKRHSPAALEPAARHTHDSDASRSQTEAAPPVQHLVQRHLLPGMDECAQLQPSVTIDGGSGLLPSSLIGAVTESSPSAANMDVKEAHSISQTESMISLEQQHSGCSGVESPDQQQVQSQPAEEDAQPTEGPEPDVAPPESLTPAAGVTLGDHFSFLNSKVHALFLSYIFCA